jgi:hypothetical protein
MVGCGGKKGSDPTPDPPGKTLLIFPEKDALCNQGTIVSATQSTVTLKWNAANNTDSYDIAVKNLLTGVSTTQSTTQTQLAVTLSTNTPYSWTVTSKSAKASTTTVSDSWKFYNSGPGTVSYAPYPAELSLPSNGQSIAATNGMVSISWHGSDVDNDIVSYDIYFDTSATPALFKAGETGSLINVPVTSGKTYYWKVVTKDSVGNTSTSDTFRFTVL